MSIIDEAKINHRTERLKELSDKQLADMYNQFQKWRYKSEEQIAMFGDLQKEISRRSKQIFK